jgi:hypothetical protein
MNHKEPSMCLNYYCFSTMVDAQTRFENGAEPLGNGGGGCALGIEDCEGCCHFCDERPANNYDWRECPNATVTDAGHTVGGISVTRAKALLRQFGGAAYTQRFDRDGGLAETTEIRLGGKKT